MIGELLDALSSFAIALVLLVVATAIGAASLAIMWFALFS